VQYVLIFIINGPFHRTYYFSAACQLSPMPSSTLVISLILLFWTSAATRHHSDQLLARITGQRQNPNREVAPLLQVVGVSGFLADFSSQDST